MFSKLQFAFGTKRQDRSDSFLHQHPITDDRPTVLVTILCAASEDARLQALKIHSARRSHRPIFVVSEPDIRAYQNAGCIFEYLPDPEVVWAGLDIGDWPGYLQERWSMINSKWHPQWTANYGLSFEQYLEKCKFRDSELP